MPTVSEILAQAGLSTYEINSIDPKLKNAFGQVLSEAESQKTSVDAFWRDTYSPGIQAWEQDRAELGRKIARAEAEKAALLAERKALADSGIVGADLPINTGQSRAQGGQVQTPGTPTFVDPNEIVSRAGQGLTQLADIEWKHRNVFGKPMNIAPSQLIAEADRQGISLTEAAERKFGFSKKEQEARDEGIRKDERSKMIGRYTDSNGLIANPVQSSNGGGMASIRKDIAEGKLKDPTRMSPQERRTQALNAIHRHVEERQQRDA